MDSIFHPYPHRYMMIVDAGIISFFVYPHNIAESPYPYRGISPIGRLPCSYLPVHDSYIWKVYHDSNKFTRITMINGVRRPSGWLAKSRQRRPTDF